MRTVAVVAAAALAVAAAQDSYDPDLKSAVKKMEQQFPALEHILESTTTSKVNMKLFRSN